MKFQQLLILLGCLLLCGSDGVLYADDCADESGAAYGLCVSYCEAMDCDSDYPNADDKACDNVRNAYHKITDNSSFPCDCPCYTEFMIAADGFDWDTYPGCYRHSEDGDGRNTSVHGPARLWNYYFPAEPDNSRCEGVSAGVSLFDKVYYEKPFSEATHRQAAACSAILLELAADNGYGECP
jgi:hypothetical protein